MKDYSKDYEKIDYKAQAKAECMFTIPMLVVVAFMWAIAFVYAI